MTEVQRARIIVKIDELVKEKVDKERELDGMRSMFESAWQTYGSELAGFEDNGLYKKVAELRKKITFLQACLKDDVDPKVAVDALKNGLNTFNQEIENLKVLKDAVQDNLNSMSFVLTVCNGEH